MQYRPKGNVITNAWQFDGDNFAKIQDIVGKRKAPYNEGYSIDNFDHANSYWVDVPPGIVAVVWVEPSKQWAGVSAGDYIVEDAKGFFYPCEKSIFEGKYEKVPETGEVITSQNVALKSIQQGRRFGNIG